MQRSLNMDSLFSLSSKQQTVANTHHLKLIVSADLTSRFSQLLEQGFILEAPLGCSVRDFICRQLDLDPRYLEKRIQTIFLDQKPVDNLDSSVIREGSILALSAAMPGLAGATLRKDGRYAAMRNRISCDTKTECQSDRKTNVTIKFFNMVAKEQGQKYFKSGIWINGSNLQWFLNKHTDDIKAKIKSVQLDDEKINLNELRKMSWQGDIFLQISTD